MKNIFSHREVYHDTILAENIDFSTDWTEIDLGALARIERDRQMVGIELKEPLAVDFDLGEIRSATGEIVRLEMRLVSSTGKIYPLDFGNARGAKLASFRPETQLSADENYNKLQIRSNVPFQVASILWTTYYIRDRK